MVPFTRASCRGGALQYRALGLGRALEEGLVSATEHRPGLLALPRTANAPWPALQLDARLLIKGPVGRDYLYLLLASRPSKSHSFPSSFCQRHVRTRFEQSRRSFFASLAEFTSRAFGKCLFYRLPVTLLNLRRKYQSAVASSFAFQTCLPLSRETITRFCFREPPI